MIKGNNRTNLKTYFLFDSCIVAPHIHDQPRLNETAYKPNEDVKLLCVADGDPEFVIVIISVFS